jgi:hypothetical protein
MADASDRVKGGKASPGPFPGPLRHFLAQLDELRSGDVPDMDQVGRLLVELAVDEEYLGPLTAEMPSESPGGKWLVKPERGPRRVLFHGPEDGLHPLPPLLGCDRNHHESASP